VPNTNVYMEQGGSKLVVASGGEIEIQSGGTFDFDGTFTIGDDDALVFGEGSDFAIEWDTAQTQDCIQFGVDGTSRTLMILEKADMSVNKSLGAQTYPTVILYDSDADNYLMLSHAGDDIALVGSSNDMDIRPGATAGDVLSLQAYDTGVGYDDMIVLTNAAAPTMVLQADGGITVNAGLTLSDAAGTGGSVIGAVNGQDITITSGNDLVLKSYTAASDVIKLQAYDTTGAYDDNIVITSAADPTVDIQADGGIGLDGTVTVSDSAGTGAGTINTVAGQKLTVQSTNASGTAAGADVDLIAGNGSTTGAGGAIDIDAGTGAGAANGGAIEVNAGASGGGATGNGGAVGLTAGAAASTTGAGGGVTLTAGASTGATAGGAVTLVAGQGGAGGAGGKIDIDSAAPASGNAAGGAVEINSAAGSGTGAGGAISIASGASGSGATGNAGSISITAASAASTAGNGGSVTITAGDKSGGGSDGTVTLDASGAVVIETDGNLVVSDQAGTGTGTIRAVTGQSLVVALSDNVATALDIQESTNDYITVNTTNNVERVEFGKPIDAEVGFDRSAYVEIFDDFLYQNGFSATNTPWILTEGTDTTTADIDINAQENGVIRLTTGDTDGTLAKDGVVIAAATPMQADSGGLVFETRLHINTAITGCSCVAGFTDTSGLEEAFTIAAGTITRVADDAAVFVYDDGATTKEWYMCACDGQAVDGGNAATGTAPVADIYQTLRIEVSSDGNTISYFIDGALEATLSGSNGVDASTNLYASIVFNTTTNASATLDVDYIYAGHTRS